MRALRLGVAADRRARAAAHLRDADCERTRAHRLALAGRDDHAGVGHGDADAGDDLEKGLVVDAVVKGRGVDVVGALDARHADRVRADAVRRLQMLGVHQEPRKLVFVQFEPEQHAQPHVVDAALHGAVHRLGVVGVVVLRPGRVQALVALPVIGLLEEDVGADARVVQLFVVFHRGGGDVDIHAADRAVLVVNAVNGSDAVEDVLDRVVHGVLARLDGKALVPHVLERRHLGGDLRLRQLFARNVLVFQMVGAVDAAVDAVVGEVERRKQHDAVAVERELDLLGELVDLGDLFGDVAGEQHRGLAVRQPGAVYAARRRLRARLFQQRVDERGVVFVCLGVAQGLEDFRVVDEFLRMEGFRVEVCHDGDSFLFGQSLSFR